ncbi:hypothetical protein HUS71_25950, partial [Pandoraea nosoerga]|nr:hypothetical protein [Pandoraea nosoerga]
NRRAQRPITIRSDRAAARLELLTRNGRSQARVIEEALERMPVPADDQREALIANVQEIVASIPPGSIPTMAEFDAMEYDENCSPR